MDYQEGTESADGLNFGHLRILVILDIMLHYLGAFNELMYWLFHGNYIMDSTCMHLYHEILHLVFLEFGLGIKTTLIFSTVIK